MRYCELRLRQMSLQVIKQRSLKLNKLGKTYIEHHNTMRNHFQQLRYIVLQEKITAFVFSSTWRGVCKAAFSRCNTEWDAVFLFNFIPNSCDCLTFQRLKPTASLYRTDVTTTLIQTRKHIWCKNFRNAYLLKCEYKNKVLAAIKVWKNFNCTIMLLEFPWDAWLINHMD